MTSYRYNVNAMQIVASARQVQVLFFGTFWNLKNIFYLWLVESAHAELIISEGQLYTIQVLPLWLLPAPTVEAI